MQIYRPSIFICVFTFLMSLAGACGRSPFDMQTGEWPSPDAQQSSASGDGKATQSSPDARSDIVWAPDMSQDTVAKDAAPLADVAVRGDLPSEGKRDAWPADIANDISRNTADTRDAGLRPTDTSLPDSRNADSRRPDARIGVGPAKLDASPGGFLVDRIAGTRSVRVAVKITNVGGQPSGPLTVAISGANADMFEIMDDGCSGLRLAASDTCEIGVRYISTAIVNSRDSATLTVSDPDRGGSTAKVVMTGNTIVRW